MTFLIRKESVHDMISSQLKPVLSPLRAIKTNILDKKYKATIPNGILKKRDGKRMAQLPAIKNTCKYKRANKIYRSSSNAKILNILFPPY